MHKATYVIALLSLFNFQAYSKMYNLPIKTIPARIDPHQLFSLFDVIVGNQIHKSLMRLTPELQLEKSLITDYQFIEDGKKLQITLGHFKFNDGTVLIAEHVINSFKRIFHLKSSMCADLDYIENASLALEGDVDKLGIIKIGTNKIQFNLAKKNILILHHLASLDTAILKLSSFKEDPNLNIGLGSFKPVSKSINHLTLENSTKTVGSLNKINYVKVSAKDIFSNVITGKVHTTEGYYLSNDQIKKIKAMGWKEYPSTIVRQLFFVLNPNLIDSKIRKTFQKAVLEHSLNKSLMVGTIRKMYGVVPDSIPGSLTKSDIPQLLDSKIQRLDNEVHFKISIQEYEAFAKSLILDVAETLKKYNIFVEVEELSVVEYTNIFHNKKNTIYLASKFLDYPDAYSILSYFKSTDLNDSFFSNDKKINIILDKACVEADLKERTKLYKEVQKIILDKNNVVPLISGSEQLGLWASSIEVVPPHPMGFHSLKLDQVKVNE